MKANEFRIGNLAKYKSQFLRIENLVKDEFWTINRGDSAEVIKLSDIEPIPITPEILKKCGFSDNDYKAGYIGIDIKAGGMKTDFVLTKPQVLGELQKHFCWEFKAGAIPFFLELEFLHQLQNLYFALTGEELEINL